MENVARAFNPKHVIQELNVEFTVPIYRAGTHGNDILTAAGRSLGMHQKLIWITLHHPGPELLAMTLWIVDCETELLVERTDDVSQIWRNSSITRNIIKTSVDKFCHVLVDGFGNPVNSHVPEILNAVLLVYMAINVLS